MQQARGSGVPLRSIGRDRPRARSLVHCSRLPRPAGLARIYDHARWKITASRQLHFAREEIMIRRLALVCLMLATGGGGAVAARGQELSAADKDRAMQYLESTKKNIVEATKGLSAAQWNFK